MIFGLDGEQHVVLANLGGPLVTPTPAYFAIALLGATHAEVFGVADNLDAARSSWGNTENVGRRMGFSCP